MEIVTLKDREILREIATRKLELSRNERNSEILEMWNKQARGVRDTPTVRLLFSNFRDEVIGKRVRCEGVEARRLEAKRSDEESHKRIYMRSEARAVARILDDSDRGDIMLDDGVTLTRFHQVALITLSGARYALLSPYGKSHMAQNVAQAYLIDTYPDTGTPSLTLVTDGELNSRIYAKYLELLELNHS